MRHFSTFFNFLTQLLILVKGLLRSGEISGALYKELH